VRVPDADKVSRQLFHLPLPVKYASTVTATIYFKHSFCLLYV